MINLIMKLLYRIPPVGSELRSQWIAAISAHIKEAPQLCYFFVCENHFEQSLVNKRKDRSILAKGAVPTIFSSDVEKEYLSIENTDKELDLLPKKHLCYFTLIRDILCSTPDHRTTLNALSSEISAWMDKPITVLNDW